MECESPSSTFSKRGKKTRPRTTMHWKRCQGGNTHPRLLPMKMLPLTTLIPAGPGRQSTSGQTKIRSILPVCYDAPEHAEHRAAADCNPSALNHCRIFQHTPCPLNKFKVDSTVGSFPGIIYCPFNRSRNAIYPKHRGKVLKARKAAFHGLKAFMVRWTLNRLFHRDRSGWRKAWILLLVFKRM